MIFWCLRLTIVEYRHYRENRDLRVFTVSLFEKDIKCWKFLEYNKAFVFLDMVIIETNSIIVFIGLTSYSDCLLTLFTRLRFTRLRFTSLKFTRLTFTRLKFTRLRLRRLTFTRLRD